MKKVDLAEVGRVVGVHGVKGEVRVLLYGTLPGFDWGSVLLDGAGRPARSYRVLNARTHKNVIIFALEGCGDRDSAGALVGMSVSVRREELPEPGKDEYYYHDLIGMDVASDDGREIGRITGIISTGGNDVLEVEGPFGEVLIPAIEASAIRVDMDGRRVVVHLLEGLLPDGPEDRQRG